VNEPTAYGAHERFTVAGRRVVVTGAAHGLGLGVVTAFAAAGATVAALDIDTEALERFDGDETVHPFAVDTGDDGSVTGAVAAAAERIGGIDAVVNCAAIYPTAPLATAGSAHLMDVVNINVAGYLRTVRAAHPWLTASAHARVVNFASITFYLGFPDGLGAYIATKGAVVGLTRALARELGPAGIGVNAVAPGAFPTRAENIIEDRPAFDETIMSSQCLKRRGTVDDIACAVLFLTSEASSFITGQTLVVDGGWVFN
jgi:NAD(P)-dependent dehydrogenase (short-subunit alcohol dehydrogenase family)